MSVFAFLVGVALLVLAVYWIDGRKKPKPHETQPIVPPKPFEPLKDYLEGKLPPEAPQNPLPPERPIPKKRSHHKGATP